MRRKPKMKVTEITVSLSGVIPVAAYENLRPGFSITAEPIDGENPDTIVTALQEYLHRLMLEEANRSKAEAIEKMYASIRFYEKDGKKYPSVTSILGFDKNWYGITDDELQQYASRGNVVEALIQHWFETQEWIDPLKVPSLKEDVTILQRGSKHFSWEDCSHKAFIEKYAEKIKPDKWQLTVYNEEHHYAGTLDILGSYDEVGSVLDIKSGTHDMRQLAAYAVCLKDVKRLVVLPVGPTTNKCGYKQPVICETIGNEFKEFLKARAKFKKRFGI